MGHSLGGLGERPDALSREGELSKMQEPVRKVGLPHPLISGEDDA